MKILEINFSYYNKQNNICTEFTPLCCPLYNTNLQVYNY